MNSSLSDARLWLSLPFTSFTGVGVSPGGVTVTLLDVFGFPLNVNVASFGITWST